MCPSPWPIREWSWIIPTQSIGGCFVPQASPCADAVQHGWGFPGSVLERGSQPGRRGSVPELQEWKNWEEEAWKLRWMPWRGLMACAGYCKVHLVPPPKRLHPYPHLPLADHPSWRAHHSSPGSSGFFHPGLRPHLASQEAQPVSVSQVPAGWRACGYL